MKSQRLKNLDDFLSRFSVFLRAVFILMLLTLFSACGDADEDVKNKVSGIKTNPLNVTISSNEDYQVSQTIGPDGGTLETTGPDGTRFILEIPKNAILDDTVISMAPVEFIDGLPFSNGLVGGVQFGPDGLMLYQPAILTVEPVDPVPISEQVGFAYSSTGQDFHLEPLTLNPDAIQVYVFGFSGAGVARGSASDASTVVPESPLARLQQKIAEALQRDRADGRDTMSEETIKIIEDAYAEYEEYLEPLLKRAETDCILAKTVIPEKLALERQKQLIGISSAEMDWSWFEKAVDNCYKEALDELRTLCDKEGDQSKIDAITTEILRIERLSQLLGIDNPQRFAEFQDILDNCKPKGWNGTITIEGNSAMDNGGWYEVEQIQGTITFNGEVGEWNGNVSGSATWSDSNGCAKNQTMEYSGSGSAVLYVNGTGIQELITGSEDVQVDITMEQSGSYTLSFYMPLDGIITMEKTGSTELCEVGVDEGMESSTTIGGTVEGDLSQNPNQLSGTQTIPIEDFEGKKVGETIITWNLSRN